MLSSEYLKQFMMEDFRILNCVDTNVEFLFPIDYNQIVCSYRTLFLKLD